MSLYLQKLLGKKVDEVSSKICCGVEMMLDENTNKFLHCKVCDRLVEYIEELYTKPTSQKTTFDEDGRIHYGQTIVKTPKEKMDIIATEFSRDKIFHNSGIVVDDQTMFHATRLMYDITIGGTKKKDNRNQLFAACLYFSAIKEGYIFTVPVLVKMLRLEKDGIKTGINFVIKYAEKNNIDMELDPPIYMLLLKHYLMNVNKMDKNLFTVMDIDTADNLRYCKDLVEFMLNNNVSYNTKIFTKCSAAIHYLLYFKKLYVGNKKDLSLAITVGQNTTITTINILVTPNVQKIMPEHLRVNPEILRYR